MSMTVALLLAFEWIPVAIPPDRPRATKFTILGIVGGFLFGLLFWMEMQRRYERALKQTMGK